MNNQTENVSIKLAMQQPNLPLNVHFDMETGDPDDACTLMILLAHPDYQLRSVTVTPGTDEQVGMVKKILRHAGKPDIPVGSPNPGYDKNCVGSFYTKWLGEIEQEKPDGTSAEVILKTLVDFPGTNLITGAPLKSYRGIAATITANRWVAQGGFAGDNIVPPHLRLAKFDGMVTCPTFNFNGDPQSALDLLANPNVRDKILISKNVCHGMIYDQEFHAALAPLADRHPSWELMRQGMSLYLDKRPGGKKFHDPLAAAVAAQPDICEYRQVEMYRARGGWGANLSETSNTWIAISANRAAFIEFLTKNG